MILISNSRRTRNANLPRRLLCVALLSVGIGVVPSSPAAVIDLSAGSNWWSIDTISTDGTGSLFNLDVGNAWLSGSPIRGPSVPATAGRGNGLTPSLNPAYMMWACGSFGELCPVLGDNLLGPAQAFFALPVNITQKKIFGSFEIIADDYVELWINGRFVFNALLEQNQAESPGFPAPQPVPLRIDISRGDISVTGDTLHLGAGLDDLLQPGENLLAVMAMNGQLIGPGTACTSPTQQVVILDTGELFCAFERLNEYLYIRGAIEPAKASSPGTLLLFTLSFAGLLWGSAGRDILAGGN